VFAVYTEVKKSLQRKKLIIKLSLFVLFILAVRLEARRNFLFAYRSVQSIILGYSVIDLMWLVGLFLVLRNWWLLRAQPHIF
jgi:hypothetical protein